MTRGRRATGAPSSRVAALWQTSPVPTIDAHNPGMPCWVDVSVETVEQRHSLMDFYASLFGWTYDEGPEETGHYTIASHDSHPVMGLSNVPDSDGTMLTYFATDDLAAAAERASALGGTVVFGPMAVMDVGSMAVVVDPTGARHGLWQPGAFKGFGELYEPGSPGWFNHDSLDPSAAAAYYSGLTGFAATEPSPGMTILADGDQWFASISRAMSPTRSARWNPIYVTDSLERFREAAVRAGGAVVLEEMPVPGSAISVVTEPVMGTEVTVMRAGDGD